MDIGPATVGATDFECWIRSSSHLDARAGLGTSGSMGLVAVAVSLNSLIAK